ncbi:nitric oxide reductase activation protein NorD [Microbaculum marinum]|uniref:VWA domain-containing protein n=1 Tax=Microbaculum marinum TaxID=1764581 RepID=A0AAW9RIQ3_9HYPH
MADRVRPALRIIETPPDTAVTRLHRLIRHRPNLHAVFHELWRRFERTVSPADREIWADASLLLFNANAGPACLLAYWRASLGSVDSLGAGGLAQAAAIGRDICCEAGASAATAAFSVLPDVVSKSGPAGSIAWMRAVALAAGPAPECVAEILARTHLLLAELTPAELQGWVATGLKIGGRERQRRIAYFTLEDPIARRILYSRRDGVTLADVERQLKAYLKALWNIGPPVRSLDAADAAAPARRVRIAGGILLVPEVFRGVPEYQARDLFRAAFAHAGAHLVHTRERFKVDQLKPMQIALINVIEDARVERQAMAEFPGLRSLWIPYHVAIPGSAQTAPALFARLARALIDPDYADDDGWVRKGRSLFEDAFALRPHDQTLSREIGGLLGNDLGQLRIQFNARAYVVEPAYRDDGLGLWDFGEEADADPETIEMMVDSVRLEQQEAETDGDRQEEAPEAATANRARTSDVPAEDGIAVATYPEWDSAAGLERTDWVTVRDYAVKPGRPGTMNELLAEQADIANRVTALVRSLKVGRPQRLKRRPEGEQLDLDATIEAEISRRVGEMPDTRIHQTKARRHRDVATMILLDVSKSTEDRVPGSDRTVLDMERVATAVLGEAMSALGDPFAIWAFASDRREDVRIIRVKDFAEPYSPRVGDRLAGLRSGLSTRLGTAIRHAGTELSSQRSFRRLMIVLTDGEPSDVDVRDSQYLTEDCRRAVLAARGRGLDIFCVGLDPAGHGSGSTIFGRGNYIPINRLADLPARLAALYFRLAVR